MADWDFDLLGDAIPVGLGKRGRPPHVPTLENRRKVIVLAAFDRSEEQIAQALSISEPTLKKHYFRELRSKQEARQRLEGKLLIGLVNEAQNGNVSAIDKLWKRLDRHDVMKLGPKPAKTKEPKLGKKEQRRVEANAAGTQAGWGELVSGGKLN